MTTESTQRPRIAGRPIAGAAVAALGLGAVVVAIAGRVDGSTAAAGVLVGVLLAVGVLALGTLSVAVVAAFVPQASLLVALLTYTLQLLALALVLVALSRSGVLDGPLDRQWLGAALAAATLTWSVAQIRLATTARIPVYDLPELPVSPVDAGAR